MISNQWKYPMGEAYSWNMNVHNKVLSLSLLAFTLSKFAVFPLELKKRKNEEIGITFTHTTINLFL